MDTLPEVVVLLTIRPDEMDNLDFSDDALTAGDRVAPETDRMAEAIGVF